MISKNNMMKIKSVFTSQELNINKIREELDIKRGNNTLRDFILNPTDEDPGIMALEKMANYAHMDFVMVPVKRLERLDSISKQNEEEFIKLINDRYDHMCSTLSQLTQSCPKKVSQKKEPTFKRNIDLSNSDLVMKSLMISSGTVITADSLDDIFGGSLTEGTLDD